MLDFITRRPEVETPSAVYGAGRKRWSEFCGFFVEDAKLYRRLCLGELAVIMGLAGGLVYKSSQSSVQPFLVKEDKLGAMTPAGPLGPPPAVTPDKIKQHLIRYVCDVRTLYTDLYAESNIATEAYAWTKKGSAAEQQLNAWFQSDPPQDRAQRESIGCKVEAITQVGNDTWLAEFTEEHRPAPNTGVVQPHNEYWQASLKVEVTDQQSEAEWWKNADRIYTTWFSFSRRAVK